MEAKQNPSHFRLTKPPGAHLPPSRPARTHTHSRVLITRIAPLRPGHLTAQSPPGLKTGGVETCREHPSHALNNSPT